MPVTAIPQDETPLETSLVPVIPEQLELPIDQPKQRFNFGPTPTDTPPSHTYRVPSQYVEDNWLAFIGPIALLVARRMDNALVNGATNAGCNVKQWSVEMGITADQLMAACNRLERFGLGEWHGDQTFLIRRHWPTVPLAILTPRHRQALLSLAD